MGKRAEVSYPLLFLLLIVSIVGGVFFGVLGSVGRDVSAGCAGCVLTDIGFFSVARSDSQSHQCRSECAWPGRDCSRHPRRKRYRSGRLVLVLVLVRVCTGMGAVSHHPHLCALCVCVL